jgi:1-phosphofructokinase family hexose kinase
VILCVTPNPAIDRTARVDRIRSDTVLRPTELVVLPGGKGVNLARAASRLGSIVTTTGIVAGHAGRWLVEALAAEGLNPRFAEAAEPGAETRTTYTIVDDAGRSILVYEPSSPMGAADAGRLVDLIRSELLASTRAVALAGSLPVGLPVTLVGDIIRAAREAGRRCLVDTSGAALRAALQAGPDVVKVALDEAHAALAGRGTESRPGSGGGDGPPSLVAARALVATGAASAIVTDGPRTVGAVDRDGAWVVEPPRVRAVSPTGSGDAVAAGFLVGLDAGRPFAEAVAHGVAAGAANALGLGAGRFDPADVERLLRSIRVRAHHGRR